MRAIGDQASCGSCCYWQLVVDRSVDEMQNEGLCRRRAPVGFASRDVQADGTDPSGERGLLVSWPRTFAEDDWCGEFTARGDFRGIERRLA